MDVEKGAAMLSAAARELRSLKRENELMGAKIEGFNMAHAMVMATPSPRLMRGEGEDLAWQIERFVELERKKTEEGDKEKSHG